MVELKQIPYGGWSRCYQLSNGRIEIVITGEVGPRLIRFGFVDGVNEFYEDTSAMGKTGGDDWRLYGGHRFWHAPEAVPRTYLPDNSPVSVEQASGFVRVTQPVESSGMGKEIDIYMDANGAHVRLVHRLKNTSMWPVECAPWALSVVAAGGVAMFPLPPRGSHPAALLPANKLVMWPYTNMADPRWTWGERFIMLRQSDGVPQKVGCDVRDGWAAYARNGHLFVKLFGYQAGAAYPDLGCNFETFTNANMLEVESLGPLQTIEPGGSIEYREDWCLFDGVPMPSNDSDIDAHVVGRVQEARQLAGQ
ncbi:MAG: hypothetical protein KJ065_03880 [Anaerolineae bacterium]|nr:hypothetical protein [Anaerolineae bacterium]